MSIRLGRMIGLVLCAGSALVGAERASAQSFPSRPITMIAPFPAGGAIDTIGRLLAERMQESLGQPVVVENVAGAAGSIGPGRVARAPGDGYTLSLGTSGTHVLNGATMSLSYDVIKDFEPIALLSSQPLMIVTRKDMPANNLAELIAWLRSNPDKATQGTTGLGSTNHLAGMLFQQATATRFAFVPYRGTNLAMQDLVAGRIDMIFDLASLSIPLVRSNTIKAFAVMAKNRLAAAPDVPTVDEQGLPGSYSSIWMGLWAPKATPADVVAKLNSAVVAAVNNPAVRSRLLDLGHELFPPEQQTPQALGEFQKTEAAKWWPIVKAVSPR
jgi:tripartite-type tricarboxylate transporter receptor subunit TctC